MSVATHYQIERSLDGVTNWTQIALVAAPTKTLTFNNYSSGGITKYFRVRAVILGVTQTALPLQSSYASSSSVTCEYGGEETSFKVERRRHDLGVWDEIASLPAGTITYNDAVDRFDYSYRVRGYNSYGYSAYSNLAILFPNSYSWNIEGDIQSVLNYSWHILGDINRMLDYSWNINAIAGYRYRFGLDRKMVLY